MSAVALADDKKPLPTGLYGKVPSKGDFVVRRLPRAFVDPWDAWLGNALARSKEQLGAAWLDFYLVSPLWRFAFGPGLCGDWSVAGVVMPSVDRIGRYFPLTLAALFPERPDPAWLCAHDTGWYDSAEAVARSSLEDGVDFDRFDEAVCRLDPVDASEAPSVEAAPGPAALEAAATAGRHVAVPAEAGPGAHWPALVARVAPAGSGGHSLWWSAGSEHVVPSLLSCRGLPHADAFAALLDGRWAQWGWSSGTLSWSDAS